MGYTHHDGVESVNNMKVNGTLTVVGTATLGSLAVGGDLSGTAGNATVAKIKNVALGTTTATNGNLLQADGTKWETVTSTSVVQAVAPAGDCSGTIGAMSVDKIKGAALDTTMTPTASNVISGDGSKWTSKSPNNAGLVTTTGNQIIEGNKTFNSEVNCADGLTTNDAEIDRLAYKAFRQVYDFDEPAAALASTVIAAALFTGGGTSGTQAIIAGVGGVMQLDTGATGSQTSTLALSNASMIKTAQEPVFTARVKTDALTHRKITVGLYKDANNYVMFEYDTANGTTPENWKLVSNNAGAGEVETDTGVAAAAAYTELLLELAADGTIVAEIDGTEVAETHAGDAADDVYALYAYIDNKAEAQSNKLDIDYFIIEQNR